jgi:hypothetical protein
LNNLLTAMMTHFSETIGGNHNAFYNDINGRLYRNRAPAETEFPYAVYFIVSGTPDDVFNKKGRNILIQFSLFSASESAVEITTMYNDLHSLFDDCTLTITSNTLIDMHETNLTTMVEDITVADGTTTVKHYAVDFEIITETA